jgi:hypothetical protein
MDEEKRAETRGAPSEMTVRCYDAAEVEKLEALHVCLKDIRAFDKTAFRPVFA